MPAEMIQLSLAPVVMISACGLLCMAQYNRLASIVARVRQFHHERLDVYHRFDAGGITHPEAMRSRFDGLEHQAHHMLRRAAMTRNALICLVACIVCMLLSSLSLGLSLFVGAMQAMAAAAFMLGLLAMLGAMALALVELAISLQQVRYEHERLEALSLHGPLPRGEAEGVGTATENPGSTSI